MIPGPTLVADLVVLTTHQTLRSRTYWASDTPPDNEIHLTVAADAIKTAFAAAFAILMPDNHFFQRVEARWYGNGNTGFFANSTSGAVAGSISTVTKEDDGISDTEDVMPDDTAIIIQKKTGKIGRSKQGRIFFGGFHERVQYAGEIIENYVASAKALAAKLNTDIVVNGSGFSTTLHGRHYDRKNNVMEPITKVYVVKGIGSRMDRRPKVLMERL